MKETLNEMFLFVWIETHTHCHCVGRKFEKKKQNNGKRNGRIDRLKVERL